MIGNMAFRGSGFLARLVYCFPKDLKKKRKLLSDQSFLRI